MYEAGTKWIVQERFQLSADKDFEEVGRLLGLGFLGSMRRLGDARAFRLSYPHPTGLRPATLPTRGRDKKIHNGLP
jgi:hypothetical protein